MLNVIKVQASTPLAYKGYVQLYSRVKLGHTWSRGLTPIHGVGVCAVGYLSKFRLDAACAMFYYSIDEELDTYRKPSCRKISIRSSTS